MYLESAILCLPNWFLKSSLCCLRESFRRMRYRTCFSSTLSCSANPLMLYNWIQHERAFFSFKSWLMLLYYFFIMIIDPCKNVKCPFNAVCVPLANDSTSCQCDATCPTNGDPVCGNDGVSYASECALKVQSCQTRKQIGVKNKGLCRKYLC